MTEKLRALTFVVWCGLALSVLILATGGVLRSAGAGPSPNGSQSPAFLPAALQSGNSLRASSHTVAQGETFVASITVEGDTPTPGVDAALNFSSAHLEVIEIIPVQNGLDEMYSSFGADYVHYSKSTLDTAVSPPFTLVQIRFRAKQLAGQTTLEFDANSCDIIDDNGVSVLANLHSGTVTVCYWADVNCDGKVDIEDVQLVAGAWRCAEGDDCYEPRYDVDGDGVITVVDVMLVVGQWGWAGS